MYVVNNQEIFSNINGLKKIWEFYQKSNINQTHIIKVYANPGNSYITKHTICKYAHTGKSYEWSQNL